MEFMGVRVLSGGGRNEPILLLKEEIHLGAKLRCVVETTPFFLLHSGMQL